MCPTHLIVLFGFILYSISCHSHRAMRHNAKTVLKNTMRNSRTPPCDVVCEAQWKSDFQVHFQKIYDTKFFDVPIDGAIIGTKQDLLSFCSLTEQKFACMKRECAIFKFDWSTDRHICVHHLDDFKASIGCLMKTHRTVHQECSSFCNRFIPRLSPSENFYINSLKLGKKARNDFMRQNEECQFIACHKLCHEHLIKAKCEPAEGKIARETVTHYYDSFMKKDYENFASPEYNNLFSSFCRRITPGQNEEEYVSGMSAFNNVTMARIMNGVRVIISDITDSP